MKLFDAINASPVEAAFRYLTSPDAEDEPNIVLIDKETPKAFHAREHYAWERRRLSLAKLYTDWRPAQDRRGPDLEPPDAITQLGSLAPG